MTLFSPGTRQPFTGTIARRWSGTHAAMADATVHELFRRTIAGLPAEWSDVKFIVIVRAAKDKGGWLYLVGYCQKDHALAHYLTRTYGLNTDFLRKA